MNVRFSAVAVVAVALALVPPLAAFAQSMPGMTPEQMKRMASPTPAPTPKPKPKAKTSAPGSMDGMQMASPTPAPAATTMPQAAPSAAPAMEMAPGMKMDGPASTAMTASDMASTTNVADPMSQEGSGTSWVPRSTQMFGWMQTHGADMTMEHGAIFPRYVSSGSERGDRRADAPNWLMFMGTHALGSHAQLGYRAMLSADALTENQTGYPLLFQSGETAHGVALHDHQHPHDLFAELALDYSVKIGNRASAYAYAGYPGEPALGPPVYMHRRIAHDMPEATIGHHWMDASHIQFGFATLGFAPSSHLKLEASTFTGREPNEIRTNFDPIHLDSYSERISWNPNDNTAIQASYGFIKSPEVLAPLTDQHRLTASLLLNKSIGLDHNWYNGFVVGENLESGGPRTQSYLAETDYQSGRNAVFARVEVGTRTAHDLVIPGVNQDTVYHVGAFSLGGVHDLSRNPTALNFGLGAQVTLGTKSAALNPVYGSATPVGFQVYLRVRPPDMAHSAMSGMSMGGH